MILARRISKRIAKLEDQFGTAQGKPPHLLVFAVAASDLAVDEDRCIEILRECGHLPTSPGLGTVNLYEIADGLNAQELERFLREHGAQLAPSKVPRIHDH